MVSNPKSVNFYYKEIKDEIKSKILTNTLKSNQRIPSERELCDIYSVSRTTIRKAIDELAAEGLLVKKPGKGTYVSSNTNSNNIKTGNLLFVRCVHGNPEKSSSISNDIFYPKVQTGVELAAATREYHCLVKTIYENNFSNNDLEQSIEKVDGIICGELHNSYFLKQLIETRLPVVLINPSVYTNDTDVISIGNITGAYQAVNHLINSGHERIAFIGGTPSSFPSKRRRVGYCEALTEAGIDIDDSLAISPGWRFEDGYQAMKDLLDKKLKITAVFTASDLLGLGAINAIKDSGFKIPNDISIIGFDDIEMCNQIKPTLSTMKVRKTAMGEVAVNVIFERLTNKREYPVNVSIPTILKKRDSVRNLN